MSLSTRDIESHNISDAVPLDVNKYLESHMSFLIGTEFGKIQRASGGLEMWIVLGLQDPGSDLLNGRSWENYIDSDEGRKVWCYEPMRDSRMSLDLISP